jgi:hypothetical protein
MALTFLSEWMADESSSGEPMRMAETFLEAMLLSYRDGTAERHSREDNFG